MTRSMLERVRGREALILACCIWAFHALLEMSITKSFLWIALIWAAHGLIFMLIMGAVLDRALRIPSQPMRMAVCAVLAVAFTLLQTTTDMYVTLTLGTGLDKLETPPGMVFNASNLEFQIAYKLNFKYYIWLFGFYTAILALLAETRDKWRARLDAQRAELDALRLQINPHFLFNAFTAMDGLLAMRRPEDAGRMLHSLSDFYRSTLLDRDDRLIPLEEEIAILQDYAAVEQVRFGNRLRLDIEGMDDASMAMVPPLLLQPIVENAIKYGDDGVSPFVVSVVVASDAAQLTVTVTNPLTQATSASGAGTGLTNVRSRMALIYGDRASLDAGPDGAVWRAQVRLPTGTF